MPYCLPYRSLAVALLICSSLLVPSVRADAWPTAPGGPGGPSPGEPMLAAPSASQLRAGVQGLSALARSKGSWQAPARVAALYAASDFEPLWRSDDAVLALRTALASAWRDGLSSPQPGTDGRSDPFDPAAGLDPLERELRFSDALFGLLDQLANGVADARGLSPAAGEPIAWRDVGAMDMALVLQRLRDGEIEALVDAARPDTPLYARLRAALLDEVQAPPTPVIGPGAALRRGSSGERVARLRTRLLSEGDLLPMEDQAAGRWGDDLESALIAFQSRNGLEADGRVGPLTLARLDLSRRERIDAIRVNLERARWFARLLGDEDRVEVNIPDHRLSVHLDQRIVWRAPVIVGKRENPTPVFTSLLDTVVLDPTWTVPRSIVEASLYDQARDDPAAFEARGYRLRDGDGVMHAPTGIDWSTMTLERFRYRVVQRPGADNALGSVKFLFANPYSVYLHDTPTRHLFARTDRALSHGCIRVAGADHLEQLLLYERAGMDRRTVATLRREQDNVSLPLDDPLTVALLYWTADADERGRLRVLADLYQRDAAILAALDGAGTFEPPGRSTGSDAVLGDPAGPPPALPPRSAPSLGTGMTGA